MSNEVAVFDAKYPENWVVMQNKITQAFREMSIDEKRIIILASPLVRLSKATEQTPIEVTASQFADLSEIDTHSAYKQLKAASKKLMKRTFVYEDKDGDDTEVQWVIRSKYANGYVSMYFTDEVIHLLKVFDSLNPYTKYLKEDILSLRLTYSIDLYHLAKKYQGMGGFTMSLDDYRKELGTPKSYTRINNLKDNAVDAPIKEINENTDINLSYENIKRGRQVVGFKFTVKNKPKPKQVLDSKRDSYTADMFTIDGLNDKQLGRIVRNPAFMAEYNHLVTPTSSAGQSQQGWDFEMVKRLKEDASQFGKRPIRDYLDY
uniref:RepB family plasmid replication initiator protein n=1 Tax=Psychrobacter sp. TaxID=56811 RepID=UPI001598CD88|nr:RepB family plasmid replication initiator protein [Psychrobacter sp.]QJS05208.1 replication protein, Rep3 superfamily [Psychrobacter sp.]